MDWALIVMTASATRTARAGRLQGSRCPADAVVAYPAAAACPRCGASAEPVQLSSRGVLWSWTVQRHAPKSPPYVAPETGFAPFAVGYVELPEGVRVAAVLDTDPDRVEIGMDLVLSVAGGVPHAGEET